MSETKTIEVRTEHLDMARAALADGPPPGADEDLVALALEMLAREDEVDQARTLANVKVVSKNLVEAFTGALRELTGDPDLFVNVIVAGGKMRVQIGTREPGARPAEA